jgi:hypothetical protein
LFFFGELNNLARCFSAGPGVAVLPVTNRYRSVQRKRNPFSVGGGAAASPTSLNSAELYNPATGAWSLTTSLNTARDSHTATLLSDGKVLITAGQQWSPSNPPCGLTASCLNFHRLLNNAELYSPDTGSWIATASLNASRASHTATLLQDGQVLVVGGDNGPESSAELYVTHTPQLAQYADLNGDGRADLIFQRMDNSFWISLSTGPSFTPPELWMDHGGTFLEGQAQYVDLNGDGKADLIFQGSDNNLWVSLSEGTHFAPPALWMDHGGSFVAGQAQYADLNGDGKEDLIFEALDGTFWVSLSTGAGFTPPVAQ